MDKVFRVRRGDGKPSFSIDLWGIPDGVSPEEVRRAVRALQRRFRRRGEIPYALNWSVAKEFLATGEWPIPMYLRLLK